MKTLRNIGFAAILAVIAASLYYPSAKDNPYLKPEDPEKAAIRKKLEELEKLKYLSIERAKSAVRAHLKDPDSAKFHHVTNAPYRATFVCGHVNAKNAFGGYTGFTEFMVEASTRTVAINDGSRKFAKTWNEICVKGKKGKP